MRTKYFTFLLFVLSIQAVIACPVCKKQQPTITQGLTHGAGPESNWDWVIVSAMAAITLAALIVSMKQLIKPGEKNADHVKQSILSDRQ